MVGCSILGCKSRGERKYEGITFHRFPDKPIIIDKWIAATGRYKWIPDKFSRVCSIHFQKEAFKENLQSATRTLLNRQAIPTLFIHTEDNVAPPLDNDNVLRPMKYTKHRPDSAPSKHAHRPRTKKKDNKKKREKELWIKNRSKEWKLAPSNHGMIYIPLQQSELEDIVAQPLDNDRPDYAASEHANSPITKKKSNKKSREKEFWIKNKSKEWKLAPSNHAMASGTSTVHKQQHQLKSPFLDTPPAYIPGTTTVQNQQYEKELKYYILTTPNNLMACIPGTTIVQNQQDQKYLPNVDTSPNNVLAYKPGTSTVQDQQNQKDLANVDTTPNNVKAYKPGISTVQDQQNQKDLANVDTPPNVKAYIPGTTTVQNQQHQNYLLNVKTPLNNVMAYKPGTSTVQDQQIQKDLANVDTPPNVMAYIPGTTTVQNQQHQNYLLNVKTPPNNVMAYKPGTSTVQDQQYQKDLANVDTPPNVMAYIPGTTSVRDHPYLKYLLNADSPLNNFMAYKPGTSTVQHQQDQKYLPNVDTPPNNVMAYKPGTSKVQHQKDQKYLPNVDTPPNTVMAYKPGTSTVQNQQDQKYLPNVDTPPNTVMAYKPGSSAVQDQQDEEDLSNVDTPSNDMIASRPGNPTVQDQQYQRGLPQVDSKSYQYQFQLTVMEYMKNVTNIESKAPNIKSKEHINKLCIKKTEEHTKSLFNNVEKEPVKKVPNVITKDYVLKVFNIENNASQIYKPENALIDHTYSKNIEIYFESQKKRKRKPPKKRLTTTKSKSIKKPQEMKVKKGKKSKSKRLKKGASRKISRQLNIKKGETIKIPREPKKSESRKISRQLNIKKGETIKIPREPKKGESRKISQEPLHALNTRHNRRKTMLHDAQYSELNIQGDFKQEPLLKERAVEYEQLNTEIMHKPYLYLHFETDDFKEELSEEHIQILNERQNLDATMSNNTFYPAMNYEADIKEETINLQEHTNESILFNTKSGCNATIFDDHCTEDSFFVEDIKQESTEHQYTIIKTETVLNQDIHYSEEIIEAEEFKEEPIINKVYDESCGVTSTDDQIYPIANHRVSDIVQLL